MTTEQATARKKRILQACIDILKSRISLNIHAMENAQAAANAEEKSSAGDKYETSRAISHIEKEMFGAQLAAIRRELSMLLAIDCTVLSKKIITGSLVLCDEATFFIAAGIGKIQFEGAEIFVLSPAAPMANALVNKTTGDHVVFNKKELRIISII